MPQATSSCLEWYQIPRKQLNRLITALTLLLTPCFCALGTLNAHASYLFYRDTNSQGLELLTRSQTNTLKVSEWWDRVWDTMLTGDNNSLSSESLYAFMLPFLLVIMLIFLARAGSDYLQGNLWQGFNRSVIPVIILSIFLAGHGLAAKAVAHSVRQLMIQGTDLMLRAQITEVNFREAIEDKLFELEFRQDVANAAKYCRALPAPTLRSPNESEDQLRENGSVTPGGSLTALESRSYDSLGCMQDLLANVQAKKAKIKQDCPHCNTTEQYADHVENNILNRVRQGFAWYVEADTSTNFGLQVAYRIDEAIKVDGPLVVQYWFISGQEFMLYLAAYLAPIMILYGSLPLPGRAGIAITYFSSFMIIALTRMVYLLLIGLGASFLSANPPNDGAEYWAQFLGYFAPVVSTAAVTGGVIAAVHAWSGQMVATVAAGVSIIAAGSGNAVSALSQRSLRNR